MSRAVRVKRNGKHTSEEARALKIRLRHEALAYVGTGARVLDLFAGPVGDMWSAVWKDACSYLGVDVEYRAFDVRPRLVCPWELAVQHLDVSAYDVFDLDSFGSPWGCLAQLTARLEELGLGGNRRVAVVTTDGSWRAVRNGRVLTIDADLRALGIPRAPRTYEGRGELSRVALGAFAERVGIEVEALRVFTSRARGSTGGGSALVYALLCGVAQDGRTSR